MKKNLTYQSQLESPFFFYQKPSKRAAREQAQSDRQLLVEAIKLIDQSPLNQYRLGGVVPLTAVPWHEASLSIVRPIFSDPDREAKQAPYIRGAVFFLENLRAQIGKAVSVARNEKDIEPFLNVFRSFGACTLAFPDVVALLVEWEEAERNAPSKEEREAAAENLKRIGNALAYIGGGPNKRLTEKERKESKRRQDLEAQWKRRTLQYLHRAWGCWLSKKKELADRGITDKTMLWKAADNITKEELYKGGKAKQEARRLYYQQIKRDLE